VALPFSNTYSGFLKCCAALGYGLAPFQKTIARAVFGPEREVAACLPRGSAKSTLGALIALHHVLSVPEASVYLGAGAKEQARIIGRIIERFARHEAIAHLVTIRHDELRLGDRRGPTVLSIVASDGGRNLGWERPTLMLGDECLIWKDTEPSLMTAMQTSLIKNPTAKLVLLSTAPMTADSIWGRIRERAMNQTVKRKGAFLDARGNGLRWLEWSLAEDASPTDMRAVKAANPAPWVTATMLGEQRLRVVESQWLALHCNRANVSSARWLPPGAWASCRATYEVGPEEPWVVGVDIGGARAATAVVSCVADEDGVRVADVQVWQGQGAVLQAVAYIESLVAGGQRIREIVFDPMRFEGEAMRLERDHGLQLVEWPQHPTRMTVCSERVHRLVVENRLRHPGHPELDRHVGAAIALPTPRGWRWSRPATACRSTR
jgi:phage terminase large subunit-like protein